MFGIQKVLAAVLAFVFSVPSAHGAAATVTFDSPRGGEVYAVGHVQRVCLGAKTRAKTVTIELSRDGGTTFETLGIIDNSAKDKDSRNVLPFTVTAPASSNCVIRAKALIGKTSVTATSSPFSIGAAGATTPGSVTAVGLADGSVTNQKLAPGAVNSEKMTSGAAPGGMVLMSDGFGGVSYTTPAAACGVTATAGNNIISALNDSATTDHISASILSNSSLTVTAGTGLSGGGAVSLGGSTTLSLANTPVSPGSYTRASITVDQQGRLTAASNGGPIGAADLAGSSILPPYLGNLARPPRILCIGDSMFGTLTPTIVTTAIPGANVYVTGQGGEYVAWAAAMLAPDTTVRGRPGNQLGGTDFTASPWLMARATVSNSCSPSTGRFMQKIADDSTIYNSEVSQTVALPDSAITDGFTFSLTMEPGNWNRGYLRILNATQGNTLVYHGDLKPEDYVTGLPVRFVVRVPANSFTSGDALLIIITTNYTKPEAVETYMYLSEPQINIGMWPTAFHATSGTPETVGAYVELGAPESGLRDLFDLIVLCYSNDAGWPNHEATEQAFSSTIDAAAMRGQRVLLCTPPPLCDAGRTRWYTGSDDGRDTPNDYFNALRRVALKHGCFFYDARADFQAKVTAGTHTIAQLMNDVVHPSATGQSLYAAAIANAVAAPIDAPVRRYGAGPSMRIGGTPNGSWSAVQTPASNLENTSLSVGQCTTGMAAWLSINPGDTLTFDALTGRQFAVIYRWGGAGGIVTATVDSEPPVTLTLAGGGNYYDRTARLANANGSIVYPYGSHKVVVTVVSGDCRIVGVVGL